MGLLNIFSKESRTERARRKNLERAVNKFAQSVDRLRALEALRNDGSPEAIHGLLRRFGMRYDKTIEDEQEKEWVFESLAEMGEEILPPLRRYLFEADSISWPLRLLEKVVEKDRLLEVLGEVLARHEPGYERDPSKKIQLLNALGGIKDPRTPAMLIPYLADMDEGVRFVTADALIAQRDEAARVPLLELFTSDQEESLRLRIRIAEGFADLGWRVEGYRGGVEKKLPEGFQLDRDGRIKKIPGREE